MSTTVEVNNSTNKKGEQQSQGDVLFPEFRSKALIHYGEECKLKSMELFEGYGLPAGLLPLEDVIEGGYVEETGFVWMKTKKKQQHHFKAADRLCQYADLVSCVVSPKKMSKISGVKAKDMLLWVPINEIVVDEAAPPKIHFKSVGGLSRSFPPEFFGRGC